MQQQKSVRESEREIERNIGSSDKARCATTLY